MREILFRAWDKSLGMSEIFTLGSAPVWKRNKTLPYWSRAGVCEILQYAEIKDAEGNKIFEGDILKICGWAVAVVGFKNGGFMITKGKFVYPLGGYKSSDIKIIGNRFENQELLKEA